MTTETAQKKTSGLPARDQIEDKHKWNLADMYADDNAWEADYGRAKELIAKAAQFTGRLAESPAVLYECLCTRTKLGQITGDLYQYAHLSRDLDNRQSTYQAMCDRAAMLDAEGGAAYSFVEPELLAIDEKKLVDLAAQFEKTNIYDFYIKELIRSRKHIRSQEVEEVLAQAGMIARGPEAIFTMLNDADLTYPSIKDEDGNEVTLTKQRFAKFMDSPDRRVREEAHRAFYSVYKDHVNALGASLAAGINTDVFNAKVRKFESCLEASLDKGNIPTSVYHALLDNTEANLTGLHDWVALRRRILKLDKIYPYDMMCPLVPERDYDVPYDAAVAEILQALKPLGDEYCAKLKDAFDARWVDVWETDGKGSGAYSWGNYRTHPFVLMNYNNTVDNMFTLAHEMGHALHSHRSNTAQPLEKAQYSIFVAEVASTLNEGLLAQHLLKKATDDQDKLYILNRQIDNTVGTFFNQVLYGRFELMIHETIEKGQALSPDKVNEMWRELTQKYYGDTMTVDDLTPYKWSRIPHFYYNFYVYQYATSYCASQAILDQFNAGVDGIVDRYLTLLASGGSDYPIELLKRCGVDMTTPTPVESTLRLFAAQVKQADEVTRE
ncbi:MAG: oligoendopeptidase F [bacterium]